MQFPDRDAMTNEQAIKNVAAKQVLERGKYYRFNPSVMATGVPIGGPSVCPLEMCTFDRGWYVGFNEGVHVFQGKPINDQRIIPVPKGYENVWDLDEIMERLRECYFHCLFIGGSIAIPDTDQSPESQ